MGVAVQDSQRDKVSLDKSTRCKVATAPAAAALFLSMHDVLAFAWLRRALQQQVV